MMTKENLYYKTGAFLLVLALLLRLAAAQPVQRRLSGLAEDPSFTRLLLHMELGGWDSKAEETEDPEPAPRENGIKAPETAPAEQMAAAVDQAPDLDGLSAFRNPLQAVPVPDFRVDFPGPVSQVQIHVVPAVPVGFLFRAPDHQESLEPGVFDQLANPVYFHSCSFV